jgi:phosphoketolase
MTRKMTQMEGTTAADGDAVATAERLSGDEVQRMDAYWRACTYLAAGMIYLRHGVDQPEIDQWTWR